MKSGVFFSGENLEPTVNINPSLRRNIRELIGRYSHHFAVSIMPLFLFQVLHPAEIIVQMAQTGCSGQKRAWVFSQGMEEDIVD